MDKGVQSSCVKLGLPSMFAHWASISMETGGWHGSTQPACFAGWFQLSASKTAYRLQESVGLGGDIKTKTKKKENERMEVQGKVFGRLLMPSSTMRGGEPFQRASQDDCSPRP